MHHVTPESTTHELSSHAEARAQQRGIRRDVINLVIAEADILLHAGEGLKSIRISRGKLKILRKQGVSAGLIERGDYLDFPALATLT